jgi:hypothetical protein
MSSRIILNRAAILGFFVLAISAFSAMAPAAHAQTAASSPTFLMTWSTTGSYIPSFYQGKALPTYGSKITASFELISPQGKILNLSGQTIYWYVNDALVGGGAGVQQVTFPPIGDAPNSMNLRVTIPNYNGAFLIHAITIPMVLPEAVIYAPYPNGEFSQNPLTVQALPYFFNISNPSDLSYTWSVNNQTGSNTENPETADITLPQGTQSGTGVDVSLNIENSNDSTVGTAAANLTYENQL